MKKFGSYIFFILLSGILFSACTPQTGSSGLRAKNTTVQGISGAKLSLGQGFVLRDNPIIVSGNTNLDPNSDLNSYLSPAMITSSGYLKSTSATCDTQVVVNNSTVYSANQLAPCFQVSATQLSNTPLQTSDGKWAYNYNTAEFLEVNTYYHINKINDNFFGYLNNDLYSLGLNGSFDSAIATGGNLRFTSKPLQIYANCDVGDNASFDPAPFTLCFGYLTSNSNMKFAQDPTIIYHEAGHYIQKLQLNMRNTTAATPQNPQVDMGSVFYNEAGAIGEGLSDFYSYFVNERPHVGEWAAGRILSASRPATENDPLHAAGISTDPSQRLSYPNFLDYDPNYPQVPVEDVHNSGMIISHYLTALSEDLKTSCNMSLSDANRKISFLISQSLSELGDLTTQGTNAGALGKINYTTASALDWFRINNPITYRSFAQTFAKNLYTYSQSTSDCNGSHYTQDKIEMLLDDYGLLLFRTYNQKRNAADPTTNPNTLVNSINRRKSILISKNLIKLDPTTNASTAFVIDSQSQISETITQLVAAGVVSSGDLVQTDTTLPYNNGNSRISPGEVIALSPNIYNDSNAIMGGIQILANDWDHVSATGAPYIFDQWPLKAEGGVDPGAVSANATPICLIQSKSTSGTATQWITQKAYRQKVAVDQSMCLDPQNDKDCFIRALKGVDQAYFSKLSPKSTFAKTLTDTTTNTPHPLAWSNVLLFQVSKHTPPGTVVNCRMRARFTNCEDCYHDPLRQNYDYKDIEYNGANPYKVIRLQFSIID